MFVMIQPEDPENVPAGQSSAGFSAVPQPNPTPLLSEDPAKVGDFWLDARLYADPAGVTYLAHDDPGTPTMLIMLSQGASRDGAARDRLAGEVNAMHIDTVIARGGRGQDFGRTANRFRPEDDDPIEPGAEPLAPWVALAYDGSVAAVAEARRVLAAVSLASTTPLGEVSGPDYQLHWIDQTQPGRWRLWPLPWPGRRDQAGWISLLASMLLMLLLSALAILLAILVFQNQPSTGSPDYVPTKGSGEPTTVTASSSSQPSQSSASPSQSESNPDISQDPSDKPSREQPSTEGTETGEGKPSRNPRLFLSN